MPPPGIPGPFALDDPDRLARLLAGAELAGVAVTEVPVPLRDASFDAWWTRTSALAGPLAKRLAVLPGTARRQLRARLQVAVQPYQTPTGLDLPGVSLLAAAHRLPGATKDERGAGYSRAIMAMASFSRSTKGSPETSTIALAMVPPVKGNGLVPG